MTIHGYCWPQSVLPGERVSLAISSAVSSCDVEIVRIGSNETIVDTWKNLAVVQQRVPANAASSGCAWAETLRIEVDEAWRTGFYLVRLTDHEGAEAEAFFVVRS